MVFDIRQENILKVFGRSADSEAFCRLLFRQKITIENIRQQKGSINRQFLCKSRFFHALEMRFYPTELLLCLIKQLQADRIRPESTDLFWVHWEINQRRVPINRSQDGKANLSPKSQSILEVCSCITQRLFQINIWEHTEICWCHEIITHDRGWIPNHQNGVGSWEADLKRQCDYQEFKCVISEELWGKALFIRIVT